MTAVEKLWKAIRQHIEEWHTVKTTGQVNKLALSINSAIAEVQREARGAVFDEVFDAINRTLEPQSERDWWIGYLGAVFDNPLGPKSKPSCPECRYELPVHDSQCSQHGDAP